MFATCSIECPLDVCSCLWIAWDQQNVLVRGACLMREGVASPCMQPHVHVTNAATCTCPYGEEGGAADQTSCLQWKRSVGQAVAALGAGGDD